MKTMHRQKKTFLYFSFTVRFVFQTSHIVRFVYMCQFVSSFVFFFTSKKKFTSFDCELSETILDIIYVFNCTFENLRSDQTAGSKK